MHGAPGICNELEFIMEQLEVDVVDLGDAKEVTKGVEALPNSEAHPDIPHRNLD